MTATQAEDEVFTAPPKPGYYLPRKAGAEFRKRGLFNYPLPAEADSGNAAPPDKWGKLVLYRLDFGKLRHFAPF